MTELRTMFDTSRTEAHRPCWRRIGAAVLSLIASPASAQDSVPFTQLIAQGYYYTVVTQGLFLMRKEDWVYVCLSSQSIDHPATLTKMQEYYRGMNCVLVNN
jgi:hypothetical protein